jgi:hypothetical protein
MFGKSKEPYEVQLVRKILEMRRLRNTISHDIDLLHGEINRIKESVEVKRTKFAETGTAIETARAKLIELLTT